MIFQDILNSVRPHFKVISIAFITLICFDFYYFLPSYYKAIHSYFYYVGIFQTVVYLSILILTLLSLFVLLFLRNNLLFYALLATTALSYFIDLTYKNVNGNGFGFQDMQIIIHELGVQNSEVLMSFSAQIAGALIASLFFVAVILLARKFNNFRLHSGWVLVLLASMIGSYTVISKTAAGTNFFPSPYKILATALYSYNNQIYYGKREALNLAPLNPSFYDNIIWILDESVTASYLSINNHKRKTTPFLEKIAQKYTNLGVTSSVSNCSSSSNIILMSGLQPKNLPDKAYNALKKPFIFQYAHNAGYKTYYLSAQSEDKKLVNYMSQYDLAHIDHFFQKKSTSTVKNYMRDRVFLTPKIVKLINEKKSKKFIYIVKSGAHFHWENTYPPSEKLYKPTLSSTMPLIPQNKARAINSYDNAVKWSVDSFFEDLLPKINLAKTIIFYTSDHGQSILYKGLGQTHCKTTNPSPDHGKVPLLIFSDKGYDLLKKTLKIGTYSQFQIFPTTLELMGYKPTAQQGMSLLKGGDVKSRKFLSGAIFGRGNNYFTKID